MGCILSFKWIFAIIGYRIAAGRGALFGFLLGWYVDTLIHRPTIHFTFRRHSPDDFAGQHRQGDGRWQQSDYGRQQRTYRQGGPHRPGWQPYVNTELQDAYRTLGVSPDATDDEVRQAFRRLALRYHPDRAAAHGEAARQEAEQQFRKVTQARDIVFRDRGL